MEAALGVARQGCDVYLVERSGKLGGNARFLRSTWQGEPIGTYLEQMVEAVKAESRIRLFINAEIKETHGALGNFNTTIITGDGTPEEVFHGATIIATGAEEAKPDEYLYGKAPNVLTHLDMDAAPGPGR